MPDRGFDIGQMRHRVTVQVPGPAPPRSNPFTGQQDRPWTTLGTFWARLEPLQGRELVNARQVKATISHRITLRVNGPLPPTARLIFPGVEEPYPTTDLALGRRVFQVASVIREGEVDGYYQVLTESTP